MKPLYEAATAVEPQPTVIPPKVASRPRRAAAFWPLAIIAGGVLAANFAVVPLMDVFSPNDWGAPAVYFCFGILPLQFLALSMFMAWGSGAYWMRLTVHWAAAAVAFVVYAVGLVVGDGANHLDDALEYFPLIAAVAVAVQVPLWVMRFWFGWRLVAADAIESIRPERNLAIRDLMTGTLIVAVLLGAIRASPDQDVSDEWGMVGLMIAGSIAATALVWLPVVWWFFAFERRLRAVVLTAIFALIAVPLVGLGVGIFDPGSFRDTWAMLGVSVSILAHGGALIAAALVAHFANWRLATPRDMLANPDLPS